MSSQRGNAQRKRPQKHQNTTKFRADLHDKSNQAKLLSNVDLSDLCAACVKKLQWRLTYKKYKTLSQPKSCTNCKMKKIFRAYRVLCSDCANSSVVKCPKCLSPKQELKSTHSATKISSEVAVQLDSGNRPNAPELDSEKTPQAPERDMRNEDLSGNKGTAVELGSGKILNPPKPNSGKTSNARKQDSRNEDIDSDGDSGNGDIASDDSGDVDEDLPASEQSSEDERPGDSQDSDSSCDLQESSQMEKLSTRVKRVSFLK